MKEFSEVSLKLANIQGVVEVLEILWQWLIEKDTLLINNALSPQSRRYNSPVNHTKSTINSNSVTDNLERLTKIQSRHAIIFYSK